MSRIARLFANVDRVLRRVDSACEMKRLELWTATYGWDGHTHRRPMTRQEKVAFEVANQVGDVAVRARAVLQLALQRAPRWYPPGMPYEWMDPLEGTAAGAAWDRVVKAFYLGKTFVCLVMGWQARGDHVEELTDLATWDDGPPEGEYGIESWTELAVGSGLRHGWHFHIFGNSSG